MVGKDSVQHTPEDVIGTPKNPIRNLLLVLCVVASAGLIGLFYWTAAKADASAIEELRSFRQSMAANCKQEQFVRPASPQLDRLYADSSRMQAVVHEQLGNLQRGQVDCDHILRSLKSVDFPVE